MSKAHEYLESLYGEKGSELEMDLRSRNLDKSVSSPEKEENNDWSTPEEDNESVFENARFFERINI